MMMPRYALLCLLMASGFGAQTRIANDVDIAEIPASLSPGERFELEKVRAHLQIEETAYNQAAASFNASCGTISVNDKAKIAECTSQYKVLSARADDVMAQKRAFAVQVNAAVASAAKPATPGNNPNSQQEAVLGGETDLHDAVSDCKGAKCGGDLSKEQTALLQARVAAASVPSANCVMDGGQGCDKPVAMVNVVVQGEALPVPEYAKKFVDAIPKNKRTDAVNSAITQYELAAKVRGDTQDHILNDKDLLVKNPNDADVKNRLAKEKLDLIRETNDEKSAQGILSMSIGLIGGPPKPKPVEVPSPQLPTSKQ